MECVRSLKLMKSSSLKGLSPCDCLSFERLRREISGKWLLTFIDRRDGVSSLLASKHE